METTAIAPAALTTTAPAALTADHDRGQDPAAVVVRARGLRRTVRGRVLLHDVDLDLHRGELVAIAGPSGAGKSTMLEALAGVAAPTVGSVEVFGSGRPLGFVPQEDIIHRDLPLGTTLRFAARLRRPLADRATIDRLVDEVLSVVGLHDHRDVRVGSLSGGQRKRASIATELLGEPEICFLDEPTSGLDPVSAAGVVRGLRALTDRGLTVVMTTHDPAQLDEADRVVLVAPGGRLAFAGSPAAARSTFGVAALIDVYDLLDRATPAGRGTDGLEPTEQPERTGRHPRDRSSSRPSPTAAFRRWLVLTHRTAALLVANRLTLAVLVGSPVLVIAMMALLFPAGAFADASGAAAAQILFWMAFAGFFFGLTFGLLQIVTERYIVRREHAGGLGTTTYLAAKLGVLVPVLAVVCTALLAMLVATDRLPPLDVRSFAILLGTLVLEATAALALGMLASAAVTDAAQATLALPMLCFPQVLFAGAIVPMATMSTVAQALSTPLATRWAFESLGRSLPNAPATDAAAAAFPEVFTGSPVTGWIVLGASAVVALAATRRLLER